MERAELGELRLRCRNLPITEEEHALLGARSFLVVARHPPPHRRRSCPADPGAPGCAGACSNALCRDRRTYARVHSVASAVYDQPRPDPVYRPFPGFDGFRVLVIRIDVHQGERDPPRKECLGDQGGASRISLRRSNRARPDARTGSPPPAVGEWLRFQCPQRRKAASWTHSSFSIHGFTQSRILLSPPGKELRVHWVLAAALKTSIKNPSRWPARYNLSRSSRAEASEGI
jgi:hypothetical protein